MTAFQTEIPDRPEIGYPGQVSDSSNLDVITCISAEDVVQGRFVVDGGIDSEGNQLAEVIDADASTELPVLGVVMRIHQIENDPAAAYPTIKAGTRFNVLRKGGIFVSCDGAFDPSDDTAFLRFTANGASKQPGMLTSGADSGKADELDGGGYLVKHRIKNVLTGAGVLDIDLNLPS